LEFIFKSGGGKMKCVKFAIVVVAIMGLAMVSGAAETTRTATILDMEGNVSVFFADGTNSPATMGMTVRQGDALVTRKDAFVLVRIEGSETATVEVSENSNVLLSELLTNSADNSQSTLLDLAMGKLLIKADKLHSEKSKFEVKTPTSVVGVRGTTFEVQVEGIE
jgi:hypothetical protein